MKKTFLMLIVAFVLSACSSLLPSVKTVTYSPWESFDDAKVAFDKIVLNKTTITELKGLGFDAFTTPNIKIMSYLDIAGNMLVVTEEEIDEGLLKCIRAKTGCLAYDFEPKSIKSKRYGNFWLDLLNFKRKTMETGWQFNALVVLVNDTVVYKLWGGNPAFYGKTEATNPLGPLQDSGSGIINRMWQP